MTDDPVTPDDLATNDVPPPSSEPATNGGPPIVEGRPDDGDPPEVDRPPAHEDPPLQGHPPGRAAWRVARSLSKLFAQENAISPGRNKASDGTIGDAAHQQGQSDHNPRYVAALGSTPVVLAADITHDPAKGIDTYAQADRLRRSKDSRISYVISNRRITGPRYGWNWSSYSGSNPHSKHMHVSVVATTLADQERNWDLATGATPPPAAAGPFEEDEVHIELTSPGETRVFANPAIANGRKTWLSLTADLGDGRIRVATYSGNAWKVAFHNVTAAGPDVSPILMDKTIRKVSVTVAEASQGAIFSVDAVGAT